MGSRVGRSTAVVAAAFVASGAALAATDPVAALSASLKAAKAQRSVHYVAEFAGRNPQTGGDEHVTIVGDAAADRGVQRITFRADGRAGRVTVAVVKAKAYVRGDAFTLENYMGFASAAAAADAGRWLVVSKGGFATVAEGVRLASAIEELRLPAPLTLRPRTSIGGIRVFGISGAVARFGHRYTETVFVRASGVPLPVMEVGHGGGNLLSVRFSRWNERVSVSAPAGARPAP